MIMIKYLFIFLYLKIALAGEWQTAAGQFCIDKCRYHNDGYHFHWCHVSDPSKYYSDGNPYGHFGYSGNSPNTHTKWDYCVPSSESTNDSLTIIDPKGPVTALYKHTKCYGDCQFNQMRSVCLVKSDHPLVFMNQGTPSYYCVDEVMPIREQLSAKLKMWCQTPCRKENSNYYFCTTMYGQDDCSPQPGIGSKGSACEYPCEKYETNWYGNDYFFCYTSEDKSTWEYCGQWNVPESKKNIVEFTRYDYVCADYCQEAALRGETYHWCNHLYWNYNETTNEAYLGRTWDYCAGHVPVGFIWWEILLIILGVIAGILLLSFGLIYWSAVYDCACPCCPCI